MNTWLDLGRQVVNILLLIFGLVWLLYAGFGTETGTIGQTNALGWAILCYLVARN